LRDRHVILLVEFSLLKCIDLALFSSFRRISPSLSRHSLHLPLLCGFFERSHLDSEASFPSKNDPSPLSSEIDAFFSAARASNLRVYNAGFSDDCRVFSLEENIRSNARLRFFQWSTSPPYNLCECFSLQESISDLPLRTRQPRFFIGKGSTTSRPEVSSVFLSRVTAPAPSLTFPSSRPLFTSRKRVPDHASNYKNFFRRRGLSLPLFFQSRGTFPSFYLMVVSKLFLLSKDDGPF